MSEESDRGVIEAIKRQFYENRRSIMLVGLLVGLVLLAVAAGVFG